MLFLWSWCPGHHPLGGQYIQWWRSTILQCCGHHPWWLPADSFLGSDNVGHNISDLELDFQVPAKTLDKIWPSHHIYPLIMPLFWHTQAMEANKLIQAWDTDWSSIYQFDHGLWACKSIAIADNRQQIPWCDSWFNGACQDTKQFMLPFSPGVNPSRPQNPSSILTIQWTPSSTHSSL